MDVQFTVQTAMFNCREVKPHFINPCCFGEDFAAWLREAISPVTQSGFELSPLIQEDYGWGFWASHGKDPFWIAIGFVGDGPQEPPAEWVISISYDPGLNVVKRIFHNPNRQAFDNLRDQVRQALIAESRIRLEPEETGRD